MNKLFGNINMKKWVPRIIFILAALLVICLQKFYANEFQQYGLFATTLTTITYIWLTHEMLVATQESKRSPYIDVSFIFCSKIDDDFIEKHSLKSSEIVNKIINDSKKIDPPIKNYIFVRIENIGEATGIEVKLDLTYKKKNIGETSDNHKSFEFGTMRSADVVVDFVDSFDVPGREDYIEITDCRTEYNTVNGKQSLDGAKKENLTKNVSSINTDRDVVVLFKR